MSELKISVCIITHRLDIFFRRAIHSVLAQTEKPFEVIVVFDGLHSELKDDSCFRGLPEEWGKIFTEQRGSGPSYVRNLGMHYCRGDWIFLLDGDDFLIPSCLEFYGKQLPKTRADVVTEYGIPHIKHSNFQAYRNIPRDKLEWNNTLKIYTKTIFAGMWKRGELPIRPALVRNEGKKYFPLDYTFKEDKVFLLSYMLEERKILLSDYCGYITNDHPGTISAINAQRIMGLSNDELRFRRVASNIQITGWTAKEKIFENMMLGVFFNASDIDYIDKTVAYFSFQQ